MIAGRDYRVIEELDQRVLGAVRVVDDSTGLPIVAGTELQIQDAAILDVSQDPPATVQSVRLAPGAVQVQKNRRGWFVVRGAPLFDTYARTFLGPARPAELPDPRVLALRFLVTDRTSGYFPTHYTLPLPRSLQSQAPDAVQTPVVVRLMRSVTMAAPPSAAVIHLTVVRTGVNVGGALVRAFASPRAPNAAPLASTLTEWREVRSLGTGALVIPGLLRFASGSGEQVIITRHPIELEVTYAVAFPATAGAVPPAEQIPDAGALLSAKGPEFVRRLPAPSDPPLTMSRPSPLTLGAGESITLTITLP